MSYLGPWIPTAALATLGASLCLANYAMIIRYYTCGTRGSMLPLMGGLTVALGCILAPHAGIRSLFWVPLLADPGCVPLLIGFAIDVLIRKRRRASKRTNREDS